MAEWDVRVARESRLHWWSPRVYVVISEHHGQQDRFEIGDRQLAEAIAKRARADLAKGIVPDLTEVYAEMTAW